MTPSLIMYSPTKLDSEIRHLLVFVRNESSVLAESYGSVNIKNTSLQYYITYMY